MLLRRLIENNRRRFNLEKRESLFALVSLLTSTSTLFCCALPAFLVFLGMGAVVAGMVSHVPGLIWFSENKVPVFVLTGFILVVSGLLQLKANRHATCPSDPRKAKACMRLKKISRIIYAVSIFFYIVGFFFAFVLIGLVS